jgi:hypothetical protein
MHPNIKIEFRREHTIAIGEYDLDLEGEIFFYATWHLVIDPSICLS